MSRSFPLSVTDMPPCCHRVSQRHEEILALPSSEKQAIECGKAGVETWEYKAKNALMYYPEGESTASASAASKGCTGGPADRLP